MLRLSDCAEQHRGIDECAYQYVLVFEGGHDDGKASHRSLEGATGG
jgi:hypothetical protein